MMNAETKAEIQARLRRVAGQVAGIERMVEDDRYCVDILMQVAAVRAALGKVSKKLLESHIQTCVTAAFDSHSPGQRAAKIEELLRIFEKNVGS